MPKKTSPSLTDFTMPLNINRLSGRVLIAPPTSSKNKEILVVYDQHSTIARWQPLIEQLQRYGRVTMPDLPGFGGMHSFYRINQKATIDNLASYLAAFIKLRYKRKSITVVAIGFGFTVVTRMLQNYPDLRKKVKLLIAIDAQAHKDDLSTKNLRYKRHRLSRKAFSSPLASAFYRNVMLYPHVLKLRSRKHLPVGLKNHKLPPLDDKAIQEAIKNNVQLWRSNDVRTFMATSTEILNLNNCHKTIDLPLFHMHSSEFDADRFKTEQHLNVIYSKVTTVPSAFFNYSLVGLIPLSNPSALLPKKIRSQLLKS